MKKSRFNEQQIATALRQSKNGTPVAELCRKLGVSETTFYVWKRSSAVSARRKSPKCDSCVMRIRGLKKLVADLSLDRQILQEVVKKMVRKIRRLDVALWIAEQWEISVRRISRLLELNRNVFRYRWKRVYNPILCARIKEIALTRYRYGLPRVHVLLRREGWLVNHKRTARIYREEGLSMRLRPPKRRKSAVVRMERN